MLIYLLTCHGCDMTSNIFDVVFNHRHLFFTTTTTTTTHISTKPVFWPVWVITTTFFYYHHVPNKAQVKLMAVCKFSFFLFSPLSLSTINQIYFRCFITLRPTNTTTTAHNLPPPPVIHRCHQFSPTSPIFQPPLAVFDHCYPFLTTTACFMAITHFSTTTCSLDYCHLFSSPSPIFQPPIAVLEVGLSITIY